MTHLLVFLSARYQLVASIGLNGLRRYRSGFRHLCLIFFITHLFHPLDCLAVEVFQDCDVRHGCGWRGAVPMLLTRRAPNNVTRPNFLFWTALALHPSTPVSDD